MTIISEEIQQLLKKFDFPFNPPDDLIKGTPPIEQPKLCGFAYGMREQ